MNFIEDFAETIKSIQGFRPDLFAGASYWRESSYDSSELYL